MNSESSVPKVDAVLQRMSLDELRVLAKKLRISRYSALRKGDLVTRIASADPKKLRSLLFPTWWAKHHNHVYGIVTVFGVILSIAFFTWPTSREWATASSDGKGRSTQGVTTIEKPIRFADYTAMTPADRQELFAASIGKQFVWEGYLSQTIGFDLRSIYAVPFDTDVGIQITPTRSATPQLYAECHFGKLSPTDSGHELAIRLKLLSMRQHVRLSGYLAGSPDAPVLREAFLEAEFPVNE